MLVLGLESATGLAGVALADEEGVIATATFSRGRRHGESIAPVVQFVLARAGVSARDLSGVCVDVGPGLFTGLRVGIATAKALSFALSIPVATATSLEVIALAMADAGTQKGCLLVPVIDARRGEVFSSRFRGAERDGIIQVEDDTVSSPEDLARSLVRVGEPVIIGGDGARRYSEIFERVDGATLAGGAVALPRVDVLATLGVLRLGAGLGIDGDAVVARYLRDADVRINWEQRLPPRQPSAVATT